MFYVLVLLVIFVIITRASLRNTKRQNAHNRQALGSGIESRRKQLSWPRTLFRGLIFSAALGLCWLILPKAMHAGHYGAFLLPLFLFIGAAFAYRTFKANQADHRFGPTHLYLDPSVPGIGGQLGGNFCIDAQGIDHHSISNSELHAVLTCTSVEKTNDGRRSGVVWHAEAPIYLKSTAMGTDASFLFEIPDECTPSREWRHGEAIHWTLTVEGDFSTCGLGKFERNWVVNVGERAASVKGAVEIPTSFLQKAEQISDHQARASALDQVSMTEDSQHIHIHSQAGRGAGFKIGGILFGAVFVIGGIFAESQHLWLNGLFLLIGVPTILISAFSLGKSIVVKIDKHTRVVRTKESCFGLGYASHSGIAQNPDQFNIKFTSSSYSKTKITEYYSLDLKTLDGSIRIADGIKGEKEALAVIDAIINRCFRSEVQASAA